MAEAADLPNERPNQPAGPLARRLERTAFFLGSAGLLAAMFADALAVLGRRVGAPLVGSIEIVQASVVLLASAAMIGATLRGAHARVHLLVGRLRPGGRRLLERIADLLGALVFLSFAAGSLWIAAELWGGHEHTELLGIPLRWLRVFWIASALTIAALLLQQGFRREAGGR